MILSADFDRKFEPIPCERWISQPLGAYSPKQWRLITRFVKDRYQPWSRASDARLREYFGWYEALGLLGVAWHNGEVAAVGTARFFHDYADYNQEFVHHPLASNVKCSLYGAIHPVFLAQCAGQIAKRYPECDNLKFYWHRNNDGLGPPRVYTMRQFKRFLLRCIYGGKRKRATATQSN